MGGDQERNGGASLQQPLQRRIEVLLLTCLLAILVERYVELKVREAKLECMRSP